MDRLKPTACVCRYDGEGLDKRWPSWDADGGLNVKVSLMVNCLSLSLSIFLFISLFSMHEHILYFNLIVRSG